MAHEHAEFTMDAKVGVRFAGTVRAATVVEDRGVFRGERIVRVRLADWDDVEPFEFEVAVSELEPVPAAA